MASQAYGPTSKPALDAQGSCTRQLAWQPQMPKLHRHLVELRTADRRYRPCDRSPVVMYRAGSLRLALRAGFELSKEGTRAAVAWPTGVLHLQITTWASKPISKAFRTYVSYGVIPG